jgi:hypothetical protein
MQVSLGSFSWSVYIGQCLHDGFNTNETNFSQKKSMLILCYVLRARIRAISRVQQVHVLGKIKEFDKLSKMEEMMSK